MKYIDYLKRMINVSKFKNVLRFPVEKTIEEDPKVKASKRRVWRALKKQPKVIKEADLFNISREDTPHEEWLRGYRQWKKSNRSFAEWKKWKRTEKKK